MVGDVNVASIAASEHMAEGRPVLLRLTPAATKEIVQKMAQDLAR